MYIMCVRLCLFSALSRVINAFQCLLLLLTIGYYRSFFCLIVGFRKHYIYLASPFLLAIVLFFLPLSLSLYLSICLITCPWRPREACVKFIVCTKLYLDSHDLRVMYVCLHNLREVTWLQPSCYINKS